MTQPKRQHYVPKVYWQGFAKNNGKVQVLEKSALSIPDMSISDILKEEAKYSYRLNVINICVKKHFFTLDGATDAEKHYGIELQELSLEYKLGVYETEIGSILTTIRQEKSLASLDKESLLFLIDWVTWLFVANPETKVFFEAKNQGQHWTNVMAISNFINCHKKLVPFFRARKWQLGTSKYPLITSDRPVNLDKRIVNIQDISGLSNAIVSIVLSPQLILVGVPNSLCLQIEMKPRELNQVAADFSNTNNCLMARKFVVSDSLETFECAFDHFEN